MHNIDTTGQCWSQVYPLREYHCATVVAQGKGSRLKTDSRTFVRPPLTNVVSFFLIQNSRLLGALSCGYGDNTITMNHVTMHVRVQCGQKKGHTAGYNHCLANHVRCDSRFLDCWMAKFSSKSTYSRASCRAEPFICSRGIWCNTQH